MKRLFAKKTHKSESSVAGDAVVEHARSGSDTLDLQLSTSVSMGALLTPHPPNDGLRTGGAECGPEMLRGFHGHWCDESCGAGEGGAALGEGYPPS
jgi:hypothetical protein